MKQSLLFILIIFISCQKETNKPFVKEAENIQIAELVEFIPESKETILTQTEDWENQVLGYFNVVKRSGYPEQMWYTSWKSTIFNDLSSYFCYAENVNGKWEKIKLNKDTNILLGNGKSTGVVEHFVFYDDDLKKYRMLAATSNGAGKTYTYLYSSDDGKIWEDKKVVFPNYYDTQFSVIEHLGLYHVYLRIVKDGNFRTVGKAIITKEGTVMQEPYIIFSDNKDVKYNQIYNHAASKLTDNINIMFPTYYDNVSDNMYISFVIEKDNKIHISNLNLNEYLFGDEQIGWGVVSPGLYPTEEKNIYWIYYYGSSLTHNKRVKEKNGYTNFYRIKIRLNIG